VIEEGTRLDLEIELVAGAGCWSDFGARHSMGQVARCPGPPAGVRVRDLPLAGRVEPLNRSGHRSPGLGSCHQTLEVRLLASNEVHRLARHLRHLSEALLRRVVKPVSGREQHTGGGIMR
jgi:hypothetical protein